MATQPEKKRNPIEAELERGHKLLEQLDQLDQEMRGIRNEGYVVSRIHAMANAGLRRIVAQIPKDTPPKQK